jgi:hypothetical protein
MITVGTAATKAREEAAEQLFPGKRGPSGAARAGPRQCAVRHGGRNSTL